MVSHLRQHALSLRKVVCFEIVHNRISIFQQQYTTQYISHLQSLALAISQYTNNGNTYFYFTSSVFEIQIPFEAAIAVCSSVTVYVYIVVSVLLSWRIVAAKSGRDVTVLKE